MSDLTACQLNEPQVLLEFVHLLQQSFYRLRLFDYLGLTHRSVLLVEECRLFLVDFDAAPVSVLQVLLLVDHLEAETLHLPEVDALHLEHLEEGHVLALQLLLVVLDHSEEGAVFLTPRELVPQYYLLINVNRHLVCLVRCCFLFTLLIIIRHIVLFFII